MQKFGARQRPPQAVSEPVRRPIAKVIPLEPYRHRRKLAPAVVREAIVETLRRAPEPPPEPVTEVRAVPTPEVRDSRIDELIAKAPLPPPSRSRVKKSKPKREIMAISRPVAKQFIVAWFGHKAGLDAFLDERVRDVQFGRRRQRLKEKTHEQMRQLEFDSLLGRIRTVVADGTNTGRRTRKGYRIIRIQRGNKGAIFFATLNERDNRLIGFYTHAYFTRSKRVVRLANRRRHSRS